MNANDEVRAAGEMIGRAARLVGEGGGRAAGGTFHSFGHALLRRFGRAIGLAEKGLHLLDVGTSGGIWGLENGYCLMVGGEQAVFREPSYRSCAKRSA